MLAEVWGDAHKSTLVGVQAETAAKKQIAWLDDYVRAPRPGNILSIGFKSKLRDVLSPSDLAEAVKRRRMRVIRMTRRNTIKLVVSTLNSHRLHSSCGEWNTRERVVASPIEIDRAEFHARLTARIRLEAELLRFVSSLFAPTLHICYEDLLHSQGDVFARVTDFLDVPNLPMSSSLVKYTNDDLREAVKNYDDLLAWYSGTRFEPMIREGSD